MEEGGRDGGGDSEYLAPPAKRARPVYSAQDLKPLCARVVGAVDVDVTACPVCGQPLSDLRFTLVFDKKRRRTLHRHCVSVM